MDECFILAFECNNVLASADKTSGFSARGGGIHVSRSRSIRGESQQGHVSAMSRAVVKNPYELNRIVFAE